MGKHIKKSSAAPRGGREPEWDSRDDRVEFDFLSEEEEDILDLDTDGDLSAFLTDEGQTEPAGGETAAAPPQVPETTVVKEEPVPEKAAPKAEKPAESRKKSSGKKKTQSAAAKARREAARSKRRFRRGLTAYVLIVLALIIGTLVYEWFALEKSQAKLDAEAAEEAARKAAIAEQQAHEKAVYRAPQLTFEAWKENADASYWADLWFAENDSPFDSRETVVDYMTQRFQAAEAFRAMDYTAENPVYVLKDGTDTLARISLTGSELNWNVSDVELLIKGTESASVRVASGSTVSCNGIELGSEYIVSSDSYFKYEPLRETLVNPVSWDTYEVSGLLLKPELDVVPPAGGIITETAEGDFLLCLDKEAGKTYQDKAVAFIKAYLFYYLSGSNNLWGNLYNVRVLLVPGTNAYNKMGETSDGVYWNSPHYNIDTSNVTAGDAVIWADNCYSVDVAYVATGVQNGQDDTISASMRIYFQQINGTFIISDFETL